MNVPAKLAAFVVVLVVGFGAAFAVGAAVGPIDDGPTTTLEDPGHGSVPDPGHGTGHGG